MKVQTKKTELATDPLEVFAQLAGSHEYCFLLETLADKYQPKTSGQSYIGVAPERIFTAKEGSFCIDGKAQQTDNPYNALREQIKVDSALPSGYIGGLVGYFSHEAIHYMEPSLEFPYERDFYDFEFGEYHDGLIFQHNQAPDYFYAGQDRSDLYSTFQKPSEKLTINFVGAAKDRVQYDHMIDQAREDIKNGRVFQVVLGNQYEYRFSGDLLNLYRELRKINPSPFMFFMKFGNTIILGASPELLVHAKPGGRAYLEALAGTIHRGKTPKEDEELAQKLLGDAKEVAEHSMLVDLARNDLGRISDIGSVRIDDLMYIKKLSHVQHISSVISGKLSSAHDSFDVLAASFPTGTLSGAPKIEAIKMIRELAPEERGPFGGTIGYFSYNGESVQAVNLRSVSAVGDKLFLNSNSGIVYDSRADNEFREITNKKAAMDQAMKPFLRGGKS
jgi:anthranilate synthase component I